MLSVVSIKEKVGVTFSNTRDFVITLSDIYILTCSHSKRWTDTVRVFYVLRSMSLVLL